MWSWRMLKHPEEVQHMKQNELDNAKRGIPSQGGKVDLDLWPRYRKSIGFLLSSWWMCMWSLKVIGQKLKSLLCPQGQSWPWPLTPWPKINWIRPLIMVNVHVKFESDWAKTEVAIVSTRSYTQSGKVDLDLWPCDPKINRVPPLIINNLHVKFESDWAKTVVCIVSTRSYTQSAKVDLDLWPRDPKSIGFLLSSWWMCMWSLKVIGQKL